MATNDRRAPPPSPSLPPVSQTADMTWDDDAVRGDRDSSSDRVTAIPELPSEVLAKQLMAEAVEEPALRTHGKMPTALGSGLASTAPPPGQRSRELVERKLEIDENALDSAIAARGRWQRAPASAASERPSQSLELDLSGLKVADSSAPKEQLVVSLPPEPGSPLAELADRYAMGDYSGALVVAEGILESDPEHADAQRFARSCREVLTGMYSARLGALDQVVRMAVAGDQIRWLSLDHRAGFLLSLVDGTLTLEEILDISGMTRLDALRIMFSLQQEGVISLAPRRR